MVSGYGKLVFPVVVSCCV